MEVNSDWKPSGSSFVKSRKISLQTTPWVTETGNDLTHPFSHTTNLQQTPILVKTIDKLSIYENIFIE